MKKKVKVLSLALVSIAGLGAVLSVSNGIRNVALGAETPVVWKHYSAVAPTKDAKGIKQYWVSCQSDTHVFVEPTGNVNIQEATWTDELKASVLALNDDRAIEKGDFVTWMESANDFIIGAKVSGVTLDAANHTYTLKAGQYAGTAEEPLTNTTDAAVHFRGQYLRVARACGYKYLSFDLKAESLVDGYVADRFAIATAGVSSVENGWKLNYKEKDLDISTFQKFEFDLSLYDSVSEEAFSVYFGIRNSNAPQYNSIESNVTIKNFQLGNFTTASTENTSNATINVTANETGLITDLVINQSAMTKGGYYDHNGLSAAYISDLHDSGINKLYVSVKATDITKATGSEDKGTPCFIRKEATASYPAFVDKWYSFTVDTSKAGTLNFGVAHDGGSSNPQATITVRIGYSELSRYDFNGQNAPSLWGVDFTGSITNANAGAGNVGGDNVCTNGAGATINGVAKGTRFYGNVLHLWNYTPANGDVVVINAGTYADPENQWGVSRSLTVENTMTFVFAGSTFVRA